MRKRFAMRLALATVSLAVAAALAQASNYPNYIQSEVCDTANDPDVGSFLDLDANGALDANGGFLALFNDADYIGNKPARMVTFKVPANVAFARLSTCHPFNRMPADLVGMTTSFLGDDSDDVTYSPLRTYSGVAAFDRCPTGMLRQDQYLPNDSSEFNQRSTYFTTSSADDSTYSTQNAAYNRFQANTQSDANVAQLVLPHVASHHAVCPYGNAMQTLDLNADRLADMPVDGNGNRIVYAAIYSEGADTALVAATLCKGSSPGDCPVHPEYNAERGENGVSTYARFITTVTGVDCLQWSNNENGARLALKVAVGYMAGVNADAVRLHGVSGCSGFVDVSEPDANFQRPTDPGDLQLPLVGRPGPSGPRRQPARRRALVVTGTLSVMLDILVFDSAHATDIATALKATAEDGAMASFLAREDAVIFTGGDEAFVVTQADTGTSPLVAAAPSPSPPPAPPSPFPSTSPSIPSPPPAPPSPSPPPAPPSPSPSTSPSSPSPSTSPSPADPIHARVALNGVPMSCVSFVGDPASAVSVFKTNYAAVLRISDANVHVIEVRVCGQRYHPKSGARRLMWDTAVLRNQQRTHAHRTGGLGGARRRRMSIDIGTFDVEVTAANEAAADALVVLTQQASASGTLSSSLYAASRKTFPVAGARMSAAVVSQSSKRGSPIVLRKPTVARKPVIYVSGGGGGGGGGRSSGPGAPKAGAPKAGAPVPGAPEPGAPEPGAPDDGDLDLLL